jgi:hypothetical protein
MMKMKRVYSGGNCSKGFFRVVAGVPYIKKTINQLIKPFVSKADNEYE